VSKRDIEYKLPDKTIYLTLMMWDILGQKDYKKIRTQGITGAHGVILVTDLTRPETMKSVAEFWLPEVWELTNNAPVVFVGNKSDLAGQESPNLKILQDIASKVEMPAMLCSAKTGDNVEVIFRKIGELMLTSDFGGKKTTEATAESLAQAVDEIVTDFCDQFGDTPRAMEIVDREFQKAHVDLHAPTKDSLLMAIEYLSDIERDTHGRDVSEVNKLRRWKMVDEAR